MRAVCCVKRHRVGRVGKQRRHLALVSWQCGRIGLPSALFSALLSAPRYTCCSTALRVRCCSLSWRRWRWPAVPAAAAAGAGLLCQLPVCSLPQQRPHFPAACVAIASVTQHVAGQREQLVTQAADCLLRVSLLHCSVTALHSAPNASAHSGTASCGT